MQIIKSLVKRLPPRPLAIVRRAAVFVDRVVGKATGKSEPAIDPVRARYAAARVARENTPSFLAAGRSEDWNKYLEFFSQSGLVTDRETLIFEDWLFELLDAKSYDEAHGAIVNHHKRLHAGRSNFMSEWFEAKPVASLIFELAVTRPGKAEALAFFEKFAKSNDPYRPYLVARAQWEIVHGNYERAIELLGYAERKHNLDPYIHHLTMRCRNALKGESFHSNPFAGRFCNKPFTQAYLQHKGKLTNCCEAWMPYALGNSGQEQVTALWTGPRAKEIRRSVIDGDYMYCSPRKCQFLKVGILPQLRKEAGTSTIPEFVKSQSERPLEDLVLSHDSSCNLECPMCRNELIMAKGDEVRRLNALEPGLLALMSKSKSVYISGSGEPLASRHFRNLLAAINTPACPVRDDFLLKFLTNGLLFTRAFWDAHPNLHGLKKSVTISADAASAETYAKVRKRGDFNKLMANFELFDELRASGEISVLKLHYTIQADNCHELEKYVDLMSAHNVDRILFLPLQPRVHYQYDTYVDQDACHPLHPKFPIVKAQLERLWERRPPALDPNSTAFALIGKSVREWYDPSMAA